MRTTRLRPQLSLAFALALAVAAAAPARAGDLNDLVVNLVKPLQVGTISTVFDCQFAGVCGGTADFITLTGSEDSLVGLQLDSLASVTSGVVNDRIVPLSSSVSGFTYDYNPDLDVYDRSTKTFGPLFSERAQTIGKRRFLVGMSQSYLEFDQYNGDDLDSISLSQLEGNLTTSGGGDEQLSGLTLISKLNATGLTEPLDVDLDLNIKEWVSTAYFTYGLTERIDIGVVVPLLRIQMDASARTRGLSSDSALPACIDQPLAPDLSNVDDLCVGTGSSTLSYNSDSESYFGVGDMVVRGKWNFLTGVASGAFLAEATIPTGDPDNLTGLHTMTYRPGIVLSRDFETPLGGLGLQSYMGYNFRPDEPDQQEFDWAVGAAVQPFGRASISLDLIGSNETRGDENFQLDGSVGLKLMVMQNVLLDFNYIAPLNNEGLRPSAGIFTAQIEAVFGD